MHNYIFASFGADLYLWAILFEFKNNLGELSY